MKLRLLLIFSFICVLMTSPSFASGAPPHADRFYWKHIEFKTYLPDPFGYCELLLTETEDGLVIEAKVLGKTISLKSELLKNLQQISVPEISYRYPEKNNSEAITFFFEVGPLKKVVFFEDFYPRDDWARDIVGFEVDSIGNVKLVEFRVEELAAPPTE